MTWRQPIPTGLEAEFGEDFACQLLYRELIYRACNETATLTLDKKKFVRLERGQVLFGRKRWGEYLCWNEKFVQRKLDDLVQKYQKVSKQATTNYTIVSIKNYEELMDMSKQCPSDVQAVSTSKSDKNNKNIVRQTQKRKSGWLKGKLPPLEYKYLYEIAKDYVVTIEDVQAMDKSVRLSIEDGNKYHLTNHRLGVEKWVANALSRGEIQIRNEVEDMIFAHQSPEEIANDLKLQEQLKVKYPNLV